MRRKRNNRKNTKIKFNIPSAIKKDVFILLLFMLAIFSALALLGIIQEDAGRFIDQLWRTVFGWGWWAWPMMLIIICYLMLVNQRLEVKTFRWLGLFLFIVAYSGILHIIADLSEQQPAIEIAKQGLGGGFVGYFIAFPFVKLAGDWGALVILLCLFLISLLLFFEKTIVDIFNIFQLPSFKFLKNLKNKFKKSNSTFDENLEAEDIGFEQRDIDDESLENKDEEQEEMAAHEDLAGIATFQQKEMFSKPKRRFARIDLPLELLSSKKSDPSSGDIKSNQDTIYNTFKQFGIDVDMGEVAVGPTVTQYTFKPASGVKVAQITTLANDLALALAAHPIRIEAPIPGKSLIGIEVPNQKVAQVSLKEILTSPDFIKRESNLMISLGKDVSGKPWLADMAKMPHLLIAGSTGSGKTVCLNSVIVSLLYQNQPADLKLILVDPKKVEMHQYNNIPHLICPVITDVKKTINALRWAVKEMERRLQLLSNAHKRNIDSYNLSRTDEQDRIPYIIIIIDELADLMATAGQEVEAAIIRLAQMARAVGIHLILATQRPSVNVITGLIKANITSRIAFAVAALMDSRTILDTSGAEKLLGRGDMLFINSTLSKPKRIQGAYLSDNEIEAVVEFLKKKAKPEYDETVTEKKPLSVSLVEGRSDEIEADLEQEDEFLPEAKELVIKTGKASASYFQRKFRIGYARAARLLDLLEEIGVVGPGVGSKPREVLARPEELVADKYLSGEIKSPTVDNIGDETDPDQDIGDEEGDQDDDQDILEDSDDEYDENEDELKN